jgi:RND family efflux transporter MFP subunit
MLKKTAAFMGIVSALGLGVFVGASGAVFSGNGEAAAEAAPAAKSMEQFHNENGLPVRVRQLAGEDFSVYLKYPTVLEAQSESTAYSALSDVVRRVAVKAGDTVTRDQVLVSFSENNRNFQQAKLSYESAAAAYNRARSLYASSDISRSDFDNIKMQYQLAQAAFTAADDMINVKAPIAGTVTQVNVRPTENVNAGTPLFTISNQSGLVARFYVGVEEIDRINVGARVFVVGAEKALEGRISDVSLVMDSKKHAFPVTASFDTKGQKVISGISVDIAVETYRNETALVLTRRELVSTGSGYAAFIANGNKAVMVDVNVGNVRGLDFEITGGLEAGDLLVCDEVDNLTDGRTLNVIASSALAAAK